MRHPSQWWGEEPRARIPVRALPLALVAGSVLGGCGEAAGEHDPPALTGDIYAAVSSALPDGFLAASAPAPGPVLVPPADWSEAVAEREPNDADSLAQPMGPTLTARGELLGRDSDYFSWTVEGDPQYWYLEAIVPGREEALYESPNGKDRLHLASIGEEADGSTVLALSGLYLLPGEHRLRLWSGDEEGTAEYRVRAVPMGPGDPRLEREPNDDEDRAHSLTPGVPRFGYLPGNDRDSYRYRLRQPERVRIEVTSPAAQRLELTVRFPAGENRTLTAPESGAPLVYEGLSPVGELSLSVRSLQGGGSDPYRIALARLDPFERPGDLEPNDDAGRAGPLPATGVAEGDASGYDRDWFRLPSTPAGTRVTLAHSLERGRARDGLRLHVSTNGARPTRIPWERDDNILTAVLPDSGVPFLEVNVDTAYRVEVRLDPAQAERLPPPAPPSVTLSLSAPVQTVAAFWSRAQRLRVPVRIDNTGDVEETLDFDALVSDPRWSAVLEPQRVSVPAGGSAGAMAVVLIPPMAASAAPVQLAVAAFGSGRGHVGAAVQILGVCGAPAVGEEDWWPVPEVMLGGLNVAALALGAGPVDEGSASWTSEETLLHDEMMPVRSGWAADNAALPVEHDVRLAGPGLSEVVGVVLMAAPEPWQVPPRRFEVLLSIDGERWERALVAELRDVSEAQSFVLPNPTTAAFAKLRIVDAHRKQPHESGQVQLGEFQVIARPATHALERRELDLADPRLGGHVVRSSPHVRYATRNILGEGRRPVFRPDPAEPSALVLGFQHDRAAQLRRIEWVQPSDPQADLYESVRIAASTESPLGPWVALGELHLDATHGGTSTLEFGSPIWARFLRFTPAEAGGGPEVRYRHFPDRLRVIERVPDEEYRSILGAWGLYDRNAIYEKLTARRRPSSSAPGNTDRARALALEPGHPVAGVVEAQGREAWYRIEVPRGENHLEIAIAQDPGVVVQVSVLTETGGVVPVERAPAPGRSALWSAAVEGGATYYVRVAEPWRNITIAWDQSGSVGPFRGALDRALTRFVEQVKPGVERLNLLPFRDEPDGRFVLDEFTDQAVLLQAGLAWNGEGDGSSEAERNLLAASRGMTDLAGTRAILLMTDAESDDSDVVPELWRSLEQDRPRIFAVELQSGQPDLQDVMQDWAAAGGGRYDYFSSADELDAAFERMSCVLRQPSLFTISATTRYREPPGPARIRVLMDSSRVPQGAIELVLNASGSMLQRLDGTRRIDIARGVLEHLIAEDLPAGTPLALRVFGHREANACRTDLEAPLAPLDRDAMRQRIRGIEAMNLARTPIGASLLEVRTDLRGAAGRKIVVLITDGEETCDGDPAAAIDSLKAWGVDPRLSVIGFAVDDEGLKAEFQRWARAGGGQYFEAWGAAELGEALRKALRPKYQIVSETGEIVAEGSAGDGGQRCPPAVTACGC